MFAAALLATTAARPTVVVTTPNGRVGSALVRALDDRGVAAQLAVAEDVETLATEAASAFGDSVSVDIIGEPDVGINIEVVVATSVEEDVAIIQDVQLQALEAAVREATEAQQKQAGAVIRAVEAMGASGAEAGSSAAATLDAAAASAGCPVTSVARSAAGPLPLPPLPRNVSCRCGTLQLFALAQKCIAPLSSPNSRIFKSEISRWRLARMARY